MDDPALDPHEHHHALAGLARINWLSGSARLVWSGLQLWLRSDPSRPLRVLDVATGAGDIPIRLQQWAIRRNLPLHFAGCDRSPTALEFARQAARNAKTSVEFFACDPLRDGLPSDYDILVSSLFLHHLENDQVAHLLRVMHATARLGIVINDLSRSRMNYGFVWLGTRLLSRSRIVHIDGPLSVRAAFTPEEIRQLAETAGLVGVQVRRFFPCRYLLTWSRR